MTILNRDRNIEHWDAEDVEAWQAGGAKIARRNLIWSIFAEHVGFSIWSIWSVMVLFMPASVYGFSAGDKFLLGAIATLVGGCLRFPYTFATAKFGGRNWTIFSALVLLIPTVGTMVLLANPGLPLWPYLVCAALAGFGGGNFASSMTNINTFYPQSRKGWALGINAGGGNLGVAVIQLVGLLVLGTAGVLQPRIVLWVFLPLIVLAALGAVFFMDNLSTARNDTKAMREVIRDGHAWVMSLLYIGTFGSFIGYAFAFGLVLQNQFHRTPIQAAGITFLGPLLGSLSRPLGGWLSDRFGGARVTFWNFVLMAVCAGVLVVAGNSKSLGLYTVGFIALFVFSGIGNGSTYKMIPGIYRAKAHTEIESGVDETTALLKARRLSGALIGIAGAIGALGGVGINLAFRQSFASAKSGTPAVVGFLAFYAVCFVVTWAVYLRKAPERSPRAALAAVRI